MNIKKTIEEKAYAKLNISLDVSRRRADGFHDMRMVMQTVSLCDDISIELRNEPGIWAKSNLQYIPSDDRNLAVKAARLFFREAGIPNTGAVISMRKSIPVGAGLAGGSADGAAVFRALNRYYEGAVSEERLFALADETGSDVSYCMKGGTALVEGKGDIIRPIDPFPDCVFVICKPEFSVTTVELFKALDRVKLRIHPDTAGIIDAVEKKDIRQICRRIYNVFEDVPDRRMKTVSVIKRQLMDFGAEGAVMTGTGSAVFGIFTDAEKAAAACPALEKEYGFCVCASPVGQLM